MNHKFKLFLFIGILLIISLSSVYSLEGPEEYGPYKQYDCITVKKLCSNCTYNNITSVVYPNGTQAIGVVQMSKMGTEFNYSNFCSTSATGSYLVSGVGDYNALPIIWNYEIIITPNGTILTLTESFLYFSLIIFCITAMIICFYQITRTNSFSWSLGYFFLEYLAFIILAYTIWYMTINYLPSFIVIGETLYYLWFIPLILLLPAILIAFMLMINQMMTQKDIDSMQERGLDDDQTSRRIKNSK